MVGHAKAKKSRVVRIDTEESWDFFIKQATDKDCPVVVHFTASWCKPSVAMNPFFEEIAMSYKDLVFLSVDVDEVKGVGAKMKIKAMPTFLLMRGGARLTSLWVQIQGRQGRGLVALLTLFRNSQMFVIDPILLASLLE